MENETFHRYRLTGIVDHSPIRTEIFVTRPAAENYVFGIIAKKGLQVDTNEFVDKHTDEIKCDDYNRFRIERI